MTGKPALRRQSRETLRSLSPETKAQASATLCTRLKAWPLFQQAAVIALFHPTPTEPDLLPLLEIPNKTFLFPLTHPDRSLTWHAPIAMDHWKPSAHGILEPPPDLSPAISPDKIHLILVPGLAFTADGQRLGHGAGYYDRFLATHPAPAAGVCFTCQVLPGLPTEPHDIPLQFLLHA